MQWSRDGRRLLAFSGTYWLVDRDGSHRRRVRVGANAGDAVLSPDGRTLALSLDACKCDNAANPFELFTRDLSGGPTHRLTRNRGYDGQPDWSPDGKQLVYATDDGLFIMDADGTHQRRITRGYHVDPRWSPDGKHVAFDTFRDVFVVDVTTGRIRRLTSNPGPDTRPAWSPDGRFIAYLSRHVCGHCYSAETPLELWVMRSDGTNAHRLTRSLAYGSPAWGRAP